MTLLVIAEFGREILGGLVTLIVLTVGWAWGRWQSLRAWRHKQFKDRVLLSLNCVDIQGDKAGLRLRTLFEKDVHDVFHNDSMIDVVRRRAREVKVGEPILRFADKDEAWHILNTVLNQIAERFVEGVIRKDMGLSTTTKWYTFCLTFEIDGGIRIQKLRVMMIEKEKLLAFPDSGDITVESEKHKIRIETLRSMKKELKANPHLFMDIELTM